LTTGALGTENAFPLALLFVDPRVNADCLHPLEIGHGSLMMCDAVCAECLQQGAGEVAALKTVLNTPLLGTEQHLAVGTPMSLQWSSAPVATDGFRVEDLMPFLLEPRNDLIA
jgi:hypothetical protein